MYFKQELITEPALLILDEPTSGLDASSTLELLEILRELADQGKAVVLTIHQPRREAMMLIDNIVLLAKGGHLAYFGPTAVQTIQYFEELSQKKCPENMNPSDYIMDVLDDGDSKVNWAQSFLESENFRILFKEFLLEAILEIHPTAAIML